MKNKEIKRLVKRATKLRDEFRRDYNNLARKFNELSIDMDNFFTSIIEENKDEEEIE